MLLALGACTQPNASRILPGELDLAVEPDTTLDPDCSYWSDVEQAMRHVPDGASCVTTDTAHAVAAAQAYSAALTNAGWRKIDDTGGARLYERVIANCPHRIDFDLYAATPPSAADEQTPRSVFVFAPHPLPGCSG